MILQTFISEEWQQQASTDWYPKPINGENTEDRSVPIINPF